MKYQLSIRKLAEYDVSLDCKYMPDGEFEIYSRALMEEMGYLDAKLNVFLIESTIDECKIEIIVDKMSIEELQSFTFSIL